MDAVRSYVKVWANTTSLSLSLSLSLCVCVCVCVLVGVFLSVLLRIYVMLIDVTFALVDNPIGIREKNQKPKSLEKAGTCFMMDQMCRNNHSYATDASLQLHLHCVTVSTGSTPLCGRRRNLHCDNESQQDSKLFML